MAPIIRDALGTSCNLVLSGAMLARHNLLMREYHLCALRGSVLPQCTRLSALPYYVPHQNHRVFLEDAWKTPGRRLEDVDTSRVFPWKTQISKRK